MPVEVRNYIRRIGAGGKFVVLLGPGPEEDGIVLFSDFSLDSQHRDIVGRWEAVEGKTVRAAGLRVRGGGWWKREGDALVLYGQSAAYGRFDVEWLRARMRPGMVGTETSVVVRV